MSKLVILDRDGVINEDSDNFIKSVDEFIPLPGSIEAIARLKRAGYAVAIATNQSGIARGLYSLETLHAMHDKLAALLAEQGVAIDSIHYCPHGPDDSCDCRKPKPGMIYEIEQMLDLPLANAVMVGDSLRDIQSAQAAGIDAVLVRTGKGQRTLKKIAETGDNTLENVPIFDDLSQFVDNLLNTDR